ncbi:hypothetical protein [Shewanella sp. NIFS-20-20]|uniref:hypothetical protein n=1 Tax=Shewanella sp. NIFS-20-20 TaxID=2853806 RepID=UPI001C460B67|nr:hypothetical protein [Shewanella sp. NIFS-20-20]MBV7317573.1 hypothetical protein [Shewanella sp. NIFS-20-20]
MTMPTQLKQWIQSISFRELTLSVDLLITGFIGYFYLQHLLQASPEQLSSASWVSGLLLEVIIYSIVLMVCSQILLAFISDKELEQPLDVREKQINLIGYKYTTYILQVGIVLAIIQYQVEAQLGIILIGKNVPFLTLHIMVCAFIIAEIVNYTTQLFKGRTGNIYE